MRLLLQALAVVLALLASGLPQAVGVTLETMNGCCDDAGHDADGEDCRFDCGLCPCCPVRATAPTAALPPTRTPTPPALEASHVEVPRRALAGHVNGVFHPPRA